MYVCTYVCMYVCMYVSKDSYASTTETIYRTIVRRIGNELDIRDRRRSNVERSTHALINIRQRPHSDNECPSLCGLKGCCS